MAEPNQTRALSTVWHDAQMTNGAPFTDGETMSAHTDPWAQEFRRGNHVYFVGCAGWSPPSQNSPTTVTEQTQPSQADGSNHRVIPGGVAFRRVETAGLEPLPLTLSQKFPFLFGP